jgi:GNAT superfamily N-acetyltransferase
MISIEYHLEVEEEITLGYIFDEEVEIGRVELYLKKPYVYVDLVYIKPEFRKMGYAKKAIAEMYSYAPHLEFVYFQCVSYSSLCAIIGALGAPNECVMKEIKGSFANTLTCNDTAELLEIGKRSLVNEAVEYELEGKMYLKNYKNFFDMTYCRKL